MPSTRSRPSPSRLRRRERHRQAHRLAAENAGADHAQVETQVVLSSDSYEATQAAQLEKSEAIRDIEKHINSYQFGNGVSEILRNLIRAQTNPLFSRTKQNRNLKLDFGFGFGFYALGVKV